MQGDVVLPPRRLTLPQFVTPQSLAGMLGWAPSLRRQFCEAAARDARSAAPVREAGGDAYAVMAAVLAERGGGFTVHELVAAADSKGRGLQTALMRAASVRLGRAAAACTPLEAARRLLESGDADLAAWIAFDALSWVDDRAQAGEAADWQGLIVEVEGSTELQAALGDYWTQWSGEITDAAGAPAPSTEADVHSAWRDAAAALRETLEPGQPRTDAVRDLLLAATAALDELRRWERLREESAAELASDVDALRLGVLDLAAAWPGKPAWTTALAAELDAPPVTREAQEALSEALGRLQAALPVSKSAEGEWLRSRAALDDDDSEAAEAAFAAAMASRRSTRATAQAAVSALLDRLGGAPTPASAEDAERAATPPAPAVSTTPSVANAATNKRGESTPALSFSEPTDESEPPPAVPWHATNERPVAAADRRESATAAPLADPPGAAAETENPLRSAPLLAPEVESGPQLPSRGDVEPHADEEPCPPHPGAQSGEEAVREALRRGRYGLAAQIASAAEALGPAGACVAAPFGGSAVLHALATGLALDAARLGAVEARFDKAAPGVLAVLEAAPPRTPVRLLALAAALKPALFSAQTSAAEVIRAAEPGAFGDALYELATFIVNALPKRGGALDLASFRKAGAADELAALRSELLKTADDAPFKNAVFHRATLIWRGLFERGPVADAIAALRGSKGNLLQPVEIAAAWIDRDVGERARQLDRDTRDAKEAKLEAKALDWLLSSLTELAASLRAWAAEARRLHGARATHSDETRELLRAHLARGLDDLSRAEGDASVAWAATVARTALSEALDRLDGRPPADDGLTLDQHLTGDLLLFDPPIRSGRAARWSEADAIAALPSALAVARTDPDFAAAFHGCVTAGRFLEAEETLGRMAAEGAAVAGLEEELRDARDVRLDSLRRRADTLRAQIDDLLGADAEGHVDPAASLAVEDLGLRLGRAERDEEALRWLDFPALEAELDGLERGQKIDADLLLEPLLRELEARAEAGAGVEALRDLADRRELTALREGLDSLRDGAELEAQREPDEPLRAFREFLTSGFAQLPAVERSPVELVAAAVAGRNTRLMRFADMELPAAEAAGTLLRAWTRLKTAGRDSAEPLREFLEAVGFSQVQVSKQQAVAGGRRFALTTQPISDRADCPVPAFGSAAKGRMDVLVIEPTLRDGVELQKLVRGTERSATSPVLVIFKALTPAAVRKNFMIEARKRASQEACALLDEATVLFLAGRSGRRLADLFAAILPCGGVQPYSDASGKTAPEMFFGRASELDQLWDRHGSSLVYGGRQLGKTALLEQVRLQRHRPKLHVVVYGELEGQTELWPLVRRLLMEAGVPIKRASSAGVAESVRAWLAEDDQRRVLMLVDEADYYLRHEMDTGYSDLIVVRNLMHETDGRCKFVFAGLHNVQRLARTPNSPLLHFGRPLRIGPLFRQELGDAREMITLPMAAAGVVFERPGLPQKILSAVAYYPSLLQTFGAALLERQTKKAHVLFSADPPLPIVVNEREVVDTLEDPRFRDSVREKFQKTLQLDERYRLITLAMVNRALERRETGGSPALSDVEVQELARGWWPQGFENDSSLAAFQGLLQEMEGLGVLVRVADGRYAIRSAAIAAMLGGKEQVDQELVELSQTPMPEALDTGALRRLDSATHVPAPLTLRQESVLLDPDRTAGVVRVVLASTALGRDALPQSLMELSQTDDLLLWTAAYDTARQFSAHLERGAEEAHANRRNLLVLTGPWLGRAMVDEALSAATTRGGRRRLKVLISPSSVDWDAADQIDERGRLWGADVLGLSPLGRSGLRQWLVSRQAPTASATVERLRELTGGFIGFLEPPGPDAPDLMATAEQTFRRLLEQPGTKAALGLSDLRLSRAVETIAQYGETDPAELEGMGVNNAVQALEHLQRLGVLDRSGASGARTLQLNPFVGALFASAP